MTEQDVVKTYINGLVAEQGVQSEFNRNLATLRKLGEEAKMLSENEYAVFLLALTYYVQDVQ